MTKTVESSNRSPFEVGPVIRGRRLVHEASWSPVDLSDHLEGHEKTTAQAIKLRLQAGWKRPPVPVRKVSRSAAQVRNDGLFRTPWVASRAAIRFSIRTCS
jgi:hypothetical protein